MPPARRTTVLVVEDDPAFRTLVRTALQTAGYAVVAVADGLSALQHIEQDLPGAVVLDMALPRVGGRDVCRELAAHPDTNGIPIIVVTGTEIGDLHPAAVAGVLHKPVHPEAVVLAVERGLRRAQEGREHP